MSSSLLDELPNEVLEFVCIFLSLQDLNRLRLVSRAMATKATQSHFASFVRCRSIEITRLALELMVDLTERSRIGCLVEELTLDGVVYNTAGLDHQLAMRTRTMVGRGCEGSGLLEMPKESGSSTELEYAARELEILRAKQADLDSLHSTGEDVRLLKQIFRNIAANTKRRGLKRLSMDVAVYRQDSSTRQHASQRLGWRSVWHVAAKTFHSVVLALADGALATEEINIFCNEYSGHCSLGCDELSRYDWQANGIASALANVQSLAISVSDRVLNETEHDKLATGDPVERLTAGRSETKLLTNLEFLESKLDEDANFMGLVGLVKSCKRLKRLDLRHCYIGRRRDDLYDCQDERFLWHLAAAVYLPTLQVLALHNLKVREQDLLTFLRSHDINDLTLHNVLLNPGGRWDPIFQHCTSKHTSINALHLEDVYQDYAQMLFATREGDIESNTIAGLHKSQNIHRQQGSDMAPITWRIPRYRKLRMDPFVEKRHDRHRDMFGHPASHFPD